MCPAAIHNIGTVRLYVCIVCACLTIKVLRLCVGVSHQGRVSNEHEGARLQEKKHCNRNHTGL